MDTTVQADSTRLVRMACHPPVCAQPIARQALAERVHESNAEQAVMNREVERLSDAIKVGLHL